MSIFSFNFHEIVFYTFTLCIQETRDFDKKNTIGLTNPKIKKK